MILRLLQQIFFLRACYLVKLEYKGSTYYPIRVVKTYMPEELYIDFSEVKQKEAYTTDWLFTVLSDACINPRQAIPELYFGLSYKLESATLNEGIFVITLKDASHISQVTNEGEDSATDYSNDTSLATAEDSDY